MPSFHSPHKDPADRRGIIVPPLFEERGIGAFFTTKHVGLSGGAITAVFGHEGMKVYMPTQRHTDEVVCVSGDFTPAVADAVVTDSESVCIGVRVADCVPVLLFDGERNVAAAVHAGWRGSVQDILGKTIRRMQERYQSRPIDIIIGIGPAIGPCCYEVGPDVAGAVRKVCAAGDVIGNRNGRHYVDLPMVNRLQALAEGVRDEHIWISGECTCCNPDRFHSYRRMGQYAGRQGGFIVPRPLFL